MHTIDHTYDTPLETIGDLRRTVLMSRIATTQPTSVDGLLRLADIALANDSVVSR